MTTYLHLEIMHIFFPWWKVFIKNYSENANETSFKKLTVIEYLKCYNDI